MPVNNNPTPNKDVAPQKTSMVPSVVALVIALAIAAIGYVFFFSGEIPVK